MTNYFSLDQIVRSFARSIGAISKQPGLFFEEMPAATEYLDSLVFLGLSLLFPGLEAMYFSSAENMPLLFLTIILVGLGITWLWTEYAHMALRMFARIDVDKAAVFRISAYASAPNILHATVIFSPPAFIWQVYLLWRGLVSHAGVENGTATVIVAIPLVMVLCIALAVVMMLALMGMDVVTPVIS